VLNEIQRYSTGGKIDAGILASFSDISVNELIKHHFIIPFCIFCIGEHFSMTTINIYKECEFECEFK
jgi:hypothetical protein